MIKELHLYILKHDLKKAETSPPQSIETTSLFELHCNNNASLSPCKGKLNRGPKKWMDAHNNF